MIDTLYDHLSEKAGLYLDEMAVFLWDEFRTMITTSSIRRALVAKGWSKNTARQHAREPNADLRELYLHNLSDFQSCFTLRKLAKHFKGTDVSRYTKESTV